MLDLRPKVLINFADPDINELFVHIVEMHGGLGFTTGANYEEVDKVITELKFYNEVPLVLRGSNCLIVGNELEKNIHAYSLARPLNEEKIYSAMTKLLN